MSLTTAAAPRVKSYKPYVHSPGANPVSAAAYTKAAQAFYPAPATPAASPFQETPQIRDTTVAPASTGSLDYDKLLADDSLLKQTLAGINAAGVAAKASEQAGIRRALIQYGAVPGGLTGDAAAAVDQVTRDLASQNTGAGLSTIARLRNAHTQSQQASDADLAARGMLRSGAYGQHAAENLLTYNQNQDTATQQLLDYFAGLVQGLMGQQDQLRQQSYGASQDALSRIIAMIQAGQIGGGQAPAPAAPPVAPTGPAEATAGVFSPLNNLTADDWARIAALPVNKTRRPLAVAV